MKVDEEDKRWYNDAIWHEIEKLADPEFVGSICFKVNMKYGKIGNMNIGMDKSIKKPATISAPNVSY